MLPCSLPPCRRVSCPNSRACPRPARADRIRGKTQAMTLTKDRPEQVVEGPEPHRRGRMANPLILFLAIGLLLLAFGWAVLQDPSVSAPTRGPASARGR